MKITSIDGLDVPYIHPWGWSSDHHKNVTRKKILPITLLVYAIEQNFSCTQQYLLVFEQNKDVGIVAFNMTNKPLFKL